MAEQAHDFNEAIDRDRKLLDLLPLGHPARPIWLDRLATGLDLRFKQTGQIQDIDEAIEHGHEGLALRPPGHPYRPVSLSTLANCLQSRFKRTGQIQDMEEAIEYDRELLSLRPPGHRHRDTALNSLADHLESLYHWTGQTQTIEEAVERAREALTLHPFGHPDRPMSLTALAIYLNSRFTRTGQIQDISEAIEHNREALALQASGHPDRATSLNRLTTDLTSRFRRTRQIQDFEESIERGREALTLRAPGHPDRDISLKTLAAALIANFTQTMHLKDLQEAIQYARAARALRTPLHADYPSILHLLSECLNALFDQTWQMKDLEEAIELGREALAFRPPGHAGRPTYLIDLADYLSHRFRQTGQTENIEEAIELGREALALRAPGHPDRDHTLMRLAVSLCRRFYRTGQSENIEEAIELGREALALRPSGHPDRDSILQALAAHLDLRFDRTGQIQDIEEAIELIREALALRAPGHPSYDYTLLCLANYLRARSTRSGQMQDLEEAIQYARKALALQNNDHPDRAAFLTSLGVLLGTRFKRAEQMHDLEEAIESHRKALALRPPGHPDRFSSLHNLAVELNVRFRRRGQMLDIEEAIEHQREVLNTCPPGPSYAYFLASLSLSLLTRFRTTSIKGDLSEAFNMFAAATESRPASVGDKLSIARHWVKAAREFRHDSILSAYAKYLAFLQHSLVISPSLEFQWESLIRYSFSTIVDAASSAIDTRQLDVAIEMLEQGRALLWSRMKGYRQPVQELRAVDEALADEFETVSNQLEKLATSQPRSTSGASEHGPRYSTAWDDMWSEQRRLSDRWDTIVTHIRQIEGFADFLQPVSFERLKHAAAEGPVIIVNVSSYRSDALILRDAISYPTLVRLTDSLHDQVGTLSDQLRQVRRQDDCTTAAVMQDVLRALWKLVAQPVVDQLRILDVAEKSRIWWCPTGKLCSLPLHAAHPFVTGERGLPDIFVSSYTPTLSSLISARENIPAIRSKYPQLLAVGRPDDSLRRVDAELEEIQGFGDFVDTLIEDQATSDAVLTNLQTHPWVHIACHGHLDDAQPFKSSFKLYEGSRLTVMDLLQARLPNAELAFLSACHSAAGNYVHTPDEVLHLAAATQFCGFRSVVGTLWAMADNDGPILSREFYKYMFRHKDPAKLDLKDSAMALMSGINALRKAGAPTHHWAAFVHIGA